MIRETSIPFFPEGVRLSGNAIIDKVLGGSHSISSVSLELLKEVDGRKTIEEIGQTIANKHGWPINQVIPDFLELISHLNSHYLINTKNPFHFNTYLKDRLVAILLFLRTLQGSKWETKQRITIPNQSLASSFKMITLSIIHVYGKFTIFLALIAAIFTFMLPVGGFYTPLTIGIFFLLGMVIHEFSHYITYQRMTGYRGNILLAVRNGGVQIVRPIANRKTEFWTSLIGPGIPVVLALFLLPFFFFSEGPETKLLIASIFVTQIVHLISLLPFAEDGKRIIDSLRTYEKKEKGSKERKKTI